MTQTYVRRDPRPLARAVVAALWVSMAADVTALLTAVVELLIYGRLNDGTARASDETALMVVTLIGGVTFIVFLVTAFLVLKWIYRVNANAHRLASGMTTTPGWAVGWYFVPVALLWKPFAGVDEAWRVSRDPDNWRTLQTPDLLRGWWALWLSSGILGNISMRLGLSAETADMLIVSCWLGIASSVLAIALDYQFITVVRRLTAMQVKTMHDRPISAENLGSGAESPEAAPSN